MTVTSALIYQTYAAIREATIRTPTIQAARLSLRLGIDLYLKLENPGFVLAPSSFTDRFIVETGLFFYDEVKSPSTK